MKKTHLAFLHRSNFELVKLPSNVLQSIYCNLHLKIYFDFLFSLSTRVFHLAPVADEVMLELLEPHHLSDPLSIAPQACPPLQNKLSHPCSKLHLKRKKRSDLGHILLANQCCVCQPV